MSGFEYNEIRPDAVEDVELLSDESSDYQQFKQRIYDTDDEIPKERERMLRDQRSNLFPEFVEILLERDCKQFAKNIFTLGVAMPDYIANPEEVKEAILLEGKYTNTQIDFGDLTPSIRGNCRHAKDDSYRPDNDDAMCCWECSDHDGGRPEKFEHDDPACDECSIYHSSGYKLKEALEEHLEIVGGGKLVSHMKHSDMSVTELRNGLVDADNGRSRAIGFAFKLAFPDEDYYYQRAEALLRDLNADVAKDSGPGAGGRRFEYEGIEQLEERFTLRDETVFKITFDDDAPPVAWRDFVEDPSEPTYKEADAIIEGEIGPIVVDFFTQRQTQEKRKQVHNYAELYEIATGEEPRAWGVTDETRGELLELDTLTGNDTADVDEGQAGLGDFL